MQTNLVKFPHKKIKKNVEFIVEELNNFYIFYPYPVVLDWIGLN